MGADAALNGWPLEVSSALIGSCTNSSYEDMTRSASIVRQALDAGIKVRALAVSKPGLENRGC